MYRTVGPIGQSSCYQYITGHETSLQLPERDRHRYTQTSWHMLFKQTTLISTFSICTSQDQIFSVAKRCSVGLSFKKQKVHSQVLIHILRECKPLNLFYTHHYTVVVCVTSSVYYFNTLTDPLRFLATAEMRCEGRLLLVVKTNMLQ